MDRTFGVLAALAFALAGCSAAPDEAASDAPSDAPAGRANGAGKPSGAAASPTSTQAPPGAMPGGFTPFTAADGKVTQGRCHMDACSWMQWESLEVVDASGGEVELRATILGGVSDHARADHGLPDYPETADGAAIDWDPEPAVVVFRCSKTRPSIQWGDEPSVVLPLHPDDFIPGAMESAARSYFVACHSDFAQGPGDEAVLKYDYRVPNRG